MHALAQAVAGRLVPAATQLRDLPGVHGGSGVLDRPRFHVRRRPPDRLRTKHAREAVEKRIYFTFNLIFRFVLIYPLTRLSPGQRRP